MLVKSPVSAQVSGEISKSLAGAGADLTSATARKGEGVLQLFSIQVASEWWLEIEHPTEYSWTSNVLTKWKCAHSREESTRYPLPVRRGWRGWKLKCFKKGVVTPPDIFQLYKNVWLVIKNPTHFHCFFFPHASWNFWGEEVQNPQKFRYSSRIAFLGIFKDPGHKFARVIWFAFWSIQLTYLC